ncbi:oxidoreductase [Aureobasidium pullulans EXF-150]|uniref:Oxidoreductase n=1 Tax=Aureobasidium pullulans EXF-150 TaxID=1043002 RepID=A0A074X055_AURPU|nr:oxidoreductase [Aureobasidium pullulans EXF-150]KEQ78835.1 oxidoreductase [Aureobasidium pullulans EXF-150]
MATPFPSPTTTWHSTTYSSLSPLRPELSAKGKTVIITGGGSGIGAETARYFAQAGSSRIALLGRREQPLLDIKASIEREHDGSKVFIFPTDVTKKSEVDATFTKFLGDDKVDILVSGAAVVGPLESIEHVNSDKFMDAIHTNISGSLFVAQAFLRHASPNATVVEINSSAAHVNFSPGFSAYSIGKLAICRLWDSLAFANPEMSVFHLQPGIVDTAMNREAGGIDAIGFSDDVSLPASFIVWLASPEARFLRGKFLWANWDVNELKNQAQKIEETAYLSVGLVGWPFDGGNWKLETAEGAWDNL